MSSIVNTISLLGKGTIFVVSKTWGEYSEKGECAIIAVSSEEKAKKICDLCEQFYEWLNELQKTKCKELNDVWNTENKVITYPKRPHKTSFDPDNLISQDKWLKNYIEPYNVAYKAYADQRVALSEKKTEWWNKQVSAIVVPDEFQELLKLELVEVLISEYVGHSYDFSFDYNEIKLMV